MNLKKKPVTGMKDILPAEMQIRDYILGQIKETLPQLRLLVHRDALRGAY